MISFFDYIECNSHMNRIHLTKHI